MSCRQDPLHSLVTYCSARLPYMDTYMDTYMDFTWYYNTHSTLGKLLFSSFFSFFPSFLFSLKNPAASNRRSDRAWPKQGPRITQMLIISIFGYYYIHPAKWCFFSAPCFSSPE
ncbi:hypothetical protein F4811DRAFT_374562 [Daldinia bambusicola]|nr:hypothetical protein F4811DRAFT_374562 [Daldinia bambusicola]